MEINSHNTHIFIRYLILGILNVKTNFATYLQIKGCIFAEEKKNYVQFRYFIR